MQNLKTDFNNWLICTKKYKTLSNGKSHSADFYKSKVNKVCKNLYHSKNNKAWKQLADEIVAILICYFIHQSYLNNVSAKQKQDAFDFLYILKQKEALNTHLCFDAINDSELIFSVFGSDKIERGKIKKALLLYYEFLKQIAYGQCNYDNFDKIIQRCQNFCNNTIKFIIEPPSLVSPQKIIKEAKDLDYIDDEQASKLTGISKTTLYEMAKKGLVKSCGSQGYSVDSLNEYFQNNHHIVENTKNDVIPSARTELFSSNEAATMLGCDESMLKYYRETEKISYVKKSPGSYLYFPDDVKRLKKELIRKKHIRENINKSRNCLK